MLKWSRPLSVSEESVTSVTTPSRSGNRGLPSSTARWDPPPPQAPTSTARRTAASTSRVDRTSAGRFRRTRRLLQPAVLQHDEAALDDVVRRQVDALVDAKIRELHVEDTRPDGIGSLSLANGV